MKHSFEIAFLHLLTLIKQVLILAINYFSFGYIFLTFNFQLFLLVYRYGLYT